MTTSKAPPKERPEADAQLADETSRRNFLKAGAGLAAGGALPFGLPGRAAAQGAADPELDRLQREHRILLRGGVVLTLDRQLGDFPRADVLIEDGKVREVRPDIAVSQDMAVVDASNRIVIPGFIDTHSHSYQGILRNILANGRVDPDYNRDIVGTLTPAVFAYSRGYGPAAQYPHDIVRLQRTYFASKEQLLTLALGAGPEPKMFALAREVGVPIVVHLRNVLPERDDGEKLLELSRAGLLRAGDEYIHCLNLPPDIWRLIKDTGGHVSLSPAIEMTMGHGTPAIQQALDNGLAPSLGTDHAVTIASDFFTLMRSTLIAQRYFALQSGRNGEPKPPALLSCRQVLEFATIEGARCANLESKVGTLAPGKDADIVMLRADRIDVWPLNSAAGTVVNLMSPRHVETVLIAGKVRKWRGNLVDVDEGRILRLMQESRDAVVRRSGFKLNL